MYVKFPHNFSLFVEILSQPEILGWPSPGLSQLKMKEMKGVMNNKPCQVWQVLNKRNRKISVSISNWKYIVGRESNTRIFDFHIFQERQKLNNFC